MRRRCPFKSQLQGLACDRRLPLGACLGQEGLLVLVVLTVEFFVACF